MKNIILFAVTICSLFSVIGCKKDWLDEKPDKNLTVPSNLKDFEAMLDGPISSSALGLGEIAVDGHYVSEERWLQGFDDNSSNAYLWRKERPYLNVGEWNNSYSRILVCNVVLEGLNKLSVKDQVGDVFNRVKGNALFHRARFFYDLSQIFCPTYADNQDNSFGLPLRLESDINLKSTRASVKETYNKVLEDLLLAARLLPEKPLFKTRGSKAAAFALLSNVYLNMDNFELAGKYADSSLRIIPDLIDYNTLNLSQRFVGLFNKEVVFHSTMSNSGIITSSARIETAVYNSYNQYDLRKQMFFRLNGGFWVFKGNYTEESGAVNGLFSGLATDEMYLVRAECYARSGNVPSAMNDLNTLMKSRWNKSVPFPTFSAIDKNDALRQILEERKKELILRGRRWIDLRRLNRDPNLAQTISRTISGVTYTLEPNSYRYTFPIPHDEVQSSGITQNPGWK